MKTYGPDTFNFNRSLSSITVNTGIYGKELYKNFFPVITSITGSNYDTNLTFSYNPSTGAFTVSVATASTLKWINTMKIYYFD